MARIKLIDPSSNVRERPDGSVLVVTYYHAVLRSLRLAVLCKWILAFSAGTLLVMGSLEAIASLGEGGPHWPLLLALADARRWLADTASVHGDGLPAWVLADLRSGLSFTLIGAAVLLGVTAGPISAVSGRLLSLVLFGITLLRAGVVIGPDRVRLRRLLWWRSFPRDRGACVQFIAELDPDRPTRDRREPIARVKMRYGYRTIRVASDMQMSSAESFSAALNYARDTIDSREQGSMAPGVQRSVS